MFVNCASAVMAPTVFAWDPHMIPQYGARAADAEVLAGAVEAAAAGAIPAATANAATNNPVLRNISTDSPRISYPQFAVPYRERRLVALGVVPAVTSTRSESGR